jgi:ankyrin repeat protein
MSNIQSFLDFVRNGDLAAVKDELDRDASLASARSASGVSAVLFSVYNGRREICDLLLARGAVLQLHDAAAVGDLSRVQEILSVHTESANAFSPDGFPVVALAAAFGHLEVVQFLAERGADINAISTNGTGYTALTGAVANGHSSIVAFLLQQGANANHRYAAGYSPLLTAAANGHLEIIKLLLSHGADPHATTSDGKSPLDLSTERHHLEVATFLRARSAR